MDAGEGHLGLGMSGLFGDERALMAELTQMSVEHAPRRFALCEVWAEAEDAGIVGWGMAFDDETLLYLPQVRALCKVRSVRRALSRYVPGGDARLVWIDAENECR